MCTKVKFSISTALMIIMLVQIFTISIFAQSPSFNWYCVHRKDHMQPIADTGISFIEKYDGYYIDKKHGDVCEDKVIYLTFDAGYENGNVERILNVMRSENVHGAFFILGNLVNKNSDLVSRMFEDGHLVCNHTYSHKSMIGKTSEEFKAELEKLETVCLEKTGQTVSRYYRPPEGKFDENSMKYAMDLGYKTVFWSFAYADWDNNNQMSAQTAKAKILDNIHNGEVMLLHPTSKTNADILADVIRELKAQGFRFGTLDELCVQ